MDTFKEVCADMLKEAVDKAPKILTTFGIVGFGLTVYLVAKAKPKADLLIDEAKAVKADELGVPQSERNDIKLGAWDTVKTVTPVYWVPALTFVLSTAAIVGSDVIVDKHVGALAAAYTLADASLKEIHKKTIEAIGEKKANEIRAAVTEEKVRQANISDDLKRFANENTNCTVFMAPMTGQIFTARIEDIKEAFIRANHAINAGDDITLNDLLYDFNSNAVDVAGVGRGVHESNVGGIFYWEAYGELIEYHFSAALVPDTEIPCLEIILDTDPKCAYDLRKCTGV